MNNTTVYQADNYTTVLPDDYQFTVSLNFWNIIQTIVITIITLFIIVGNITNIFIISKSIDIFSVTGYFMISLAVADLGVGLLVSPLSIGASIYQVWTSLYGWTMCQISGLVTAALCAISIWSITLLTVEKYVYIVHPMHYSRLLTTSKCVLAILAKWIICFGYFIAHKFWWDSYYYDEKAYICTIDFPKEWPFTIFVILTIVTPPAIIIIYCNYHTFKVAHNHAKQIESVVKSISKQHIRSTIKSPSLDAEATEIHTDDHTFTTNEGPSSSHSNSTIATSNTRNSSASLFSSSTQMRGISKQQWRALKMNTVIAGAFCIAWVPYSVIQIILGFSNINIPQPIIFVIQWTAFANSFWNSLFYFHLNTVYRNRAIRLFRKLFCRGRSMEPAAVYEHQISLAHTRAHDGE